MKELIQGIGGVINSLTLLVAGVSLLIFFWGLARFIFRHDGSEKGAEEGRNIMAWGLLTLFVMMSVWGIVRFMQSELGLITPNSNLDTQGVPDRAPFPDKNA